MKKESSAKAVRDLGDGSEERYGGEERGEREERGETGAAMAAFAVEGDGRKCQGVRDPLIEAEYLVEDVSIDGMCGVY